MVAVAPQFLGAIHGGIGVFQQGVDIVAILGRNGDADTRSDVQIAPFDPERRAQGIEHFNGDFGGILLLRQPLQQDHEFIPAQAGHQIAMPQATGQPRGHGFEQQVPHGVPQAVVNGFEPVQIEKEDRPDFRPLASLNQNRRQLFGEHPSIGQAGQGIVQGQIVHRFPANHPFESRGGPHREERQ